MITDVRWPTLMLLLILILQLFLLLGLRILNTLLGKHAAPICCVHFMDRYLVGVLSSEKIRTHIGCVEINDSA